MSYILTRYQSYSETSSRDDLAGTLRLVINEPPHTFDSSTRQTFVQVLIDDLAACSAGNTSRLSRNDASLALAAVKTLGKIPQGAETISRPPNLKTLLAVSESFADAPEVRNETWRCFANTLLLMESARATWVSKDTGGGEATFRALQKTNDPEFIFLLSRTMLLSTVSATAAGPFIRWLVEDNDVVDTVTLRLDGLSTGVLSGQRMSREAISEVLKFVYNILVHYPRVADQIVSPDANTMNDDNNEWDVRLNGILAPLLRLFNTLPPAFPLPLSPPLTHLIHALTAIPVSPTLLTTWFPASPTGGNSPTIASGPSASGSDRASTPTKQSTLDRALSVLGRRSIQGRGSPSSAAPPVDTLQRAYDLLEVSLSHLLPGDIDPDDSSVRDRAKRETDSTLDELLAPLVLLLIRLCQADETCRKRMSDWLFPADLDRTGPALEARSDTLGRCLRLLGSLYASHLKDAVGELLFAVCDSDSGLLVAQVGYGNVAGFLYNKGIMAAPPRSESVPRTTSNGQAINPITGVAYRETSAPDMTDEEKEQEAEKLFVLFDRLEKTGAIQPSQNPVRQAMQERQRREG